LLAKAVPEAGFLNKGSFSVTIRRDGNLDALLKRGPLAVAEAFVRGDLEVEGDLVTAVRDLGSRIQSGPAVTLLDWLARRGAFRLQSRLQTRKRAANNVRYHYDHSNEFYKLFLDSRMVYSCAYFRRPGDSLEEAQLAKLDLICRKLGLQPGHRFLDIGCGWGALVLHAAERYGAVATGCTLSRKQLEYARTAGGDKATFLDADYRDLSDRFDRIASVGMFEHVGRTRLRSYFAKVLSLVEDDGLFLNHGIVRPQTLEEDAASLFWRRRVFPGGDLVHLSEVCAEAERAGFEVLDVENLRLHYALTCRAWVERLQRNAEACTAAAGRETYRTRLLHLAASAASFADGRTDVYQILLAKRSHPHSRPLTREYMYR